MKPKLKIDTDKAVLQGPLTIRYHKEVAALLQKLTDSNVSQIVVDKPSELDLSSVQMLWSLYITKKKSNNRISVVFNLNEQDHNLLSRCGFSSLLTTTL
jgi:hypothetical protein